MEITKILKLQMMLWSALLASCSDFKSPLDPPETYPYDPSRPVVISDFTPKEGSAGTRLYIMGSNFGTDVSKIAVTVGGAKAKVVGSDGEAVYCVVPNRSTEGTIRLTVSNGESTADVTAPSRFKYIFRTVVSTLCGYISPTGEYEVKDGPFDDCGFEAPQWFSFDPKNKNHLYLVEMNQNLRLVDLEKREVSTIISKGQAHWGRARTIAWTHGADTLIVSNQSGGQHTVANTIAYRKELFKKPYTLNYTDEQCTTSVVHPVCGEMYYNEFETGDLFRYDWETGVAEKLFTIQDRNWEYNVVFHPTGDYAYIIVTNQHYIMKSKYNWNTHRLQTPTLFCGEVGQAAWVDGTGNGSRFNVPQQGCFVRNPDYAAHPGQDQYDFYVADVFNHCIRKITPEGKVTTFAGRGSQSVNGDVWGYIDGELREEARFNQPNGIAYDEETKTFYIADAINKRIRMIEME